MKKLSWNSVGILIISLLVTGILVLTACSTSPSTQSTAKPPAQTTQATTQATAPAAPKVLKIGTVIPLTHPVGLEIKKWHDLFAKMINEAGGWKIGNDTYTINFIAYDGGYQDPITTRTAVEKAVYQDGVKILVNNWSADRPTILTVTEPNKVLVLADGNTDETVAKDVKYYIRSSGIYFANGFMAYVFQDFLKAGAKTGLTVTLDNDFGHFGAAQDDATRQWVGIQNLQSLYVPIGASDMTSVATKVMSLNPGMIGLRSLTGDTIVNMISSLKDAGYKGKICPGATMTGRDFANIVQKVGSYFDGVEVMDYDPHHLVKDPKVLAYVDRYVQEYKDFRTDGTFWIAGWWILKDAIETTKSVDPDTLNKYLRNGPHAVQTLTGYSQLMARPDLGNYQTIDSAPGHGVGIVKNGNIEGLWTVSVKDQYLGSIGTYQTGDVYKKYWDQYGKPAFPSETGRWDFSDIK